MTKSRPKDVMDILKNQTRPEFVYFADNNQLSARESDVLAALLARVTSNEDIAEMLELSPNTVSNHLKSIYSKTETLNKTELMSFFANCCLNHLDKAKRYSKIPRVLIVDDEEDIIDLFQEGLSRHGLKVEVAGDGETALKLFEQNHHDVIISDIRMPVKSGMDLLRNIKIDIGANPLFIFITGFPDFTVEDCMAEGAADFVTKPCTVDDLYDRIVFNYIESSEEKARYLGIRADHFEQLSYKILRKFDLSQAMLGHGGMFIPAKSGDLNGSMEKLVGTKIKFSWQIDQSSKKLSIMGEVCWIRVNENDNGPAGLGLKFVLLSPEDERILHDHVRRQGIIAFIPRGNEIQHDVAAG
jgi:DNA-binding NarL/FixJ family response regulator/Tfp pilus assembly protein PilZ